MGRWCRPRGGLFQRDLVRNGVLISEEEQVHRAYLRRRQKRLNPTLQTIPEEMETEEIEQEEPRKDRFVSSRCGNKKKRSSPSSSSSSMPGFFWVSKIRKLEYYSCVEHLARLALVL